MQKQERHEVMKRLLDAKEKNDISVFHDTFQLLIQDDKIEWDLVNLILSSIPKLENSETTFEYIVSELENHDDIPENTYTCLISNYSYFKKADKALEYVRQMKQHGFPVKNRHLVSLLQLANQTNNNTMIQEIQSLMESSPLLQNQKVQAEKIRLFTKNGEENKVIDTLHEIARQDRYIIDSSIIDSLQYFCSQFPNWKINSTFIHSNSCSQCKSLLKLNPISMEDRSHLLKCLDDLTSTSFNRKKWFDKFKNDMEKIPKIDVVLDGANIGFANANRKINRQNVYLNAQNIEWVIQELQDQGLQSFVILHHYHINHLLKSNPSQIDILEKLHQQNLLYYVREGSNDDWYWLYLALSQPNRYIVSNDQMRDHLFHAENDEMLFRQFREESQITYNIPPVHNSKSFIKFYFPKPYSLNIQEGPHSFHLPFGHMEKSSFHLEKWYCLSNCAKRLVNTVKKLRFVVCFKRRT